MDEDLEVDRSHDMHRFLEYEEKCWTCGGCTCHNSVILQFRCSGIYEVRHVVGDGQSGSSAA